MNNGIMSNTSEKRSYAERLIPSVSFYLATVLLIPAITILMMPFNIVLGVVYGVIAYFLIIALFLALSKKISVERDRFNAGRASIPLEHIGTVSVLKGDEFRLAIGRSLDARAHLVISGWIKEGVKLEITDSDDPTPYWVVSTRHPDALLRAIEQAKGSN